MAFGSISNIDETYDDLSGKDFTMTIINTNARSLCPKIESLITCLVEMDAAFGVITETWFTTSIALENDLADLRGRAGLSVLATNRDPNSQGVSHGGVAIVFNEARCGFVRIDVANPSGWEVVVGCGRFVGFGKPVLVAVSYTHLTLPTIYPV